MTTAETKAFDELVKRIPPLTPPGDPATQAVYGPPSFCGPPKEINWDCYVEAEEICNRQADKTVNKDTNKTNEQEFQCENVAWQIWGEIEWAKVELDAQPKFSPEEIRRELRLILTALKHAVKALDKIQCAVGAENKIPRARAFSDRTHRKKLGEAWIPQTPKLLKAAWTLRHLRDEVLRALDGRPDSGLYSRPDPLECADCLVSLVVSSAQPYSKDLESKEKAARESMTRLTEYIQGVQRKGGESTGTVKRRRNKAQKDTQIVALELMIRIRNMLLSAGAGDFIAPKGEPLQPGESELLKWSVSLAGVFDTENETTREEYSKTSPPRAPKVKPADPDK